MPDTVGLLVFFAAVAVAIAAGANGGAQWGLRRMSLGAAGVLSAAAGALANGSPWWIAVGLWGAQQLYVGWGFAARRKRTGHERATYLEASATVLGCLAVADGGISPAERDIIRTAYDAAGYSPEELSHVEAMLTACTNRFLSEGSDTDRLFHRLRAACGTLSGGTDRFTREELVRAGVLVVTSHGYTSAIEQELIRAAAIWLGLRQEQFESTWREVSAARRVSTGGGHHTVLDATDGPAV